MYVYTRNIQYILGLGQSKLSIADHALLLVAPATTAVCFSLIRHGPHRKRKFKGGTNSPLPNNDEWGHTDSQAICLATEIIGGGGRGGDI
jgi:hypothetical protein